jgi:hypothetical protein
VTGAWVAIALFAVGLPPLALLVAVGALAYAVVQGT